MITPKTAPIQTQKYELLAMLALKWRDFTRIPFDKHLRMTLKA